MIVVSDTSVITNLWKVNQLQLLPLVFNTVFIPLAVQSELFRIPAQREDLEAEPWLITQSPTDKLAIHQLLIHLDAGESEAIVLATELNADYLLIDETTGRTIAQQKGLRISGTLGVLIKAKHQRVVESVKPIMDDLIQEARFFIHQRLYDEVLKLTGENP